MEYNKNLFRKANDKKVLHKIKKHWVVVSAALLMAIGGRALTVHTAHADPTNNNQNSTLKNRINESLNHLQVQQPRQNQKASIKQITQQANILHNRIVENAGQQIGSQSTQQSTQERAGSAKSNVNNLESSNQSSLSSTAQKQSQTLSLQKTAAPQLGDNDSSVHTITSGWWSTTDANSAYYTLDSNGTLTLSDHGLSGHSDLNGTPNSYRWPSDFNYNNVGFNRNLRNLVTTIDFKNPIKLPSNSSSLFAHMINLQTFNGTNLDTSNVTNMSNMFTGDTNLQNVTLNELDLSKVTTMSNMFNADPGLTTVTFSQFHQQADSLSDVTGLFSGDHNLTSFTPFQIGTNSSKVSDLDLSSAFQNDYSLPSLDLSNWYLTNPEMSDTFESDHNLGTLKIQNLSNSDSSSTLDSDAFSDSLLTTDNINGRKIQITLNHNANFNLDSGLSGDWMSTNSDYQKDPNLEPPRQLNQPNTDLGNRDVTWQRVNPSEREQNIKIVNQAGTTVVGSENIYKPLQDDGLQYGNPNYITPNSLVQLPSDSGYRVPTIEKPITTVYSKTTYGANNDADSSFEKNNFTPLNGAVVTVVGQSDTETIHVDVNEDSDSSSHKQNGSDNSNPYNIDIKGNYGDTNDAFSANGWYGTDRTKANQAPTGYHLITGAGDVDIQGNLHFNFTNGKYNQNKNAGYDNADGQPITPSNPNKDTTVVYYANQLTLPITYRDQSDQVAYASDIGTNYNDKINLPNLPSGYISDSSEDDSKSDHNSDNNTLPKKTANEQNVQVNVHNFSFNGNTLNPLTLHVHGYPEDVPINFVNQNSDNVGSIKDSSNKSGNVWGYVGHTFNFSDYKKQVPLGYTVNSGQPSKYTIKYDTSDIKKANPSNDPMSAHGMENPVTRYVTGEPVHVQVLYQDNGTTVTNGKVNLPDSAIGDSITALSDSVPSNYLLAKDQLPNKSANGNTGSLSQQNLNDYEITASSVTNPTSAWGNNAVPTVTFKVPVRSASQMLTVNYIDLKHPKTLLDSRQQKINDGSHVYVQESDMSSSSKQLADPALNGYHFASLNDYKNKIDSSDRTYLNQNNGNQPLTKSDFSSDPQVHMNASGDYPTLTVYMIGNQNPINIDYVDPNHPSDQNQNLDQYKLGHYTINDSNILTGDTIKLPQKGATASSGGDNGQKASDLTPGYYIASDQASSYTIRPADVNNGQVNLHLQVVGSAYNNLMVPVTVHYQDGEGKPQGSDQTVYVPIQGRVGDTRSLNSKTFQNYIPRGYTWNSNYNGFDFKITPSDASKKTVNSNSWLESGSTTPLSSNSTYWDKNNQRPLVTLKAKKAMPIDFYLVDQNNHLVDNGNHGIVSYSDSDDNYYGNSVKPSDYFKGAGSSKIPQGYSYIEQSSDKKPLKFNNFSDATYYPIHVQGNKKTINVQYYDGSSLINSGSVTNHRVGDTISLTDQVPIKSGYILKSGQTVDNQQPDLYTITNNSSQNVQLQVQNASNQIDQYKFNIELVTPSDKQIKTYQASTNVPSVSGNTVSFSPNDYYPNNDKNSDHYKLIQENGMNINNNQGSNVTLDVVDGHKLQPANTLTDPLFVFQAQSATEATQPITVHYIDQDGNHIYSDVISNFDKYYNESISDVTKDVPNLATEYDKITGDKTGNNGAYTEDGFMNNKPLQNHRATFNDSGNNMINIYFHGKMVNKTIPVKVTLIGKKNLLSASQVSDFKKGAINGLQSDDKGNASVQNTKTIYVPLSGEVGDEMSFTTRDFVNDLPVGYQFANGGNVYNSTNYSNEAYTAKITASDYPDPRNSKDLENSYDSNGTWASLGNNYKVVTSDKHTYPLVVLQGQSSKPINLRFINQDQRQVSNVTVNNGIVGDQLPTSPTINVNQVNPYLALIPNGYEYDTSKNNDNNSKTFGLNPIDDDIQIIGHPETVYVSYQYNGQQINIPNGTSDGGAKSSDGKMKITDYRVGDQIEFPTSKLPAGYQLANGQSTNYVINYNDVDKNAQNRQNGYWVNSDSSKNSDLSSHVDNGTPGTITRTVQIVPSNRTLRVHYVDQNDQPIYNYSFAGIPGNNDNLTSILPNDIKANYQFNNQSDGHYIKSDGNPDYSFNQSDFDPNHDGYMYSDTVHMTGDAENVPVRFINQDGYFITNSDNLVDPANVNNSNVNNITQTVHGQIGNTVNLPRVPSSYTFDQNQNSQCTLNGSQIQYKLSKDNVQKSGQPGEMNPVIVHVIGNRINANQHNNSNLVTIHLHYEDASDKQSDVETASEYINGQIGSDYNINANDYDHTGYHVVVDSSHGKYSDVTGTITSQGTPSVDNCNFYYQAQGIKAQPITVNYLDNGYLVESETSKSDNNYVGQIVSDVTKDKNDGLGIPSDYQLSSNQNPKVTFGTTPQSIDLQIHRGKNLQYNLTVNVIEKDSHDNTMKVNSYAKNISLSDLKSSQVINPSQYQPKGFNVTTSDQPVTVTATPNELDPMPSSVTWNYEAIQHGQPNAIDQPICFRYAYSDANHQLQTVGGPYTIWGNLNSDVDLVQKDGVPTHYDLNSSDQKTHYTITDQSQGCNAQGQANNPITLMVHPIGNYRPFNLKIRVLEPTGSNEVYSDVTKVIPITVGPNNSVQHILVSDNYPSYPSGNDKQDYTFDAADTKSANANNEFSDNGSNSSIKVTNNPTGLSNDSGTLVFRAKTYQNDKNINPITVNYIDQNGNTISSKSFRSDGNYEGQKVNVNQLLSTPAGYSLEPNQNCNYTFDNQAQNAYLYVYGNQNNGNSDLATITVQEEDPSGNPAGFAHYKMQVPVNGQIGDKYIINASDFIPNGYVKDTSNHRDQPISGQIAANPNGTSHLNGATSTTFYYKLNQAMNDKSLKNINVTFKNGQDDQVVTTKTLPKGKYNDQIVPDVTQGLMSTPPLSYYKVDTGQNLSGIYSDNQDDNVTIMVTPKGSSSTDGGHAYTRYFDQIIQYYDSDGTTLQRTKIIPVKENGVDGTSVSINAPATPIGYSEESDYSHPINLYVTQHGLMSKNSGTDNVVVPENSAVYKYKADANPSNLGSITVNYWDNGHNVGSGTINNDYASKNGKRFYIGENFSVPYLEQLVPLDSNYAIDSSQNQSYTMPGANQNIVANIQVHGDKETSNVAHLTLVLENHAGSQIGKISRPVTINGYPGQDYDISPDSFTTSGFMVDSNKPNSANSDLTGTILSNGNISNSSKTFYYLATDQNEAVQPITVDYLDHGVLVNTGVISSAKHQLGSDVTNVATASTWDPTKNGYDIDSNQSLSDQFTDRPQTVDVQIHHHQAQTQTFQIIQKLEGPKNDKDENGDSDEYTRYVTESVTQPDGDSQKFDPSQTSNLQLPGYTLDKNDQKSFTVYAGANGLYRSDSNFPYAHQSLLTDNPIVLHYHAKSSQNVQPNPNPTSDAQPISLTYKDEDNGQSISGEANMRINGYTGQYIDVTNPQNGGIAIPSGYELAPNQNVIHKIGTSAQNITVGLNEAKSGPSDLNLDIVKEGLNGQGIKSDYNIQIHEPEGAHVNDLFPVYPDKAHSSRNQFGKNYQPAGYHPDTTPAYQSSDQKFSDQITSGGLSVAQHTFHYAPSKTGSDGVSNINVKYYDDRTGYQVGKSDTVDGQMDQQFNVAQLMQQLGNNAVPKGYTVDQNQNQTYQIGLNQVTANVMVHGNPATNQNNADRATVEIYEEDPYGNTLPGYPITAYDVVTGNVGDHYTITASDYRPNGFDLDTNKANGRSGDSDLTGTIQTDGSINNKNVSFYYMMPSQDEAKHNIHVIYEDSSDNQVVQSDTIHASTAKPNYDYNGKLVNVIGASQGAANADNQQSPVPNGYTVDNNQYPYAAFSNQNDTYITVKVHANNDKANQYTGTFKYIEPVYDGDQTVDPTEQVDTRVVPVDVTGLEGQQFTVGAPSLPDGYVWKDPNEVNQKTIGRIEAKQMTNRNNCLSIDHATYALEATNSKDLDKNGQPSDKNAHPINVTFKDGSQVIGNARVDGYMNQVIDILGSGGTTLPKNYRLANPVQQRFYTIGLNTQSATLQVVPANAVNATVVYKDQDTQHVVAQDPINALVGTSMSSLYPKYESLLPYGYKFVSSDDQKGSNLKDNGQYVINVQKLTNSNGWQVRVQPNPVPRKSNGQINVTYEDDSGNPLATYDLTDSNGTSFSQNDYVGGPKMPQVFSSLQVDSAKTNVNGTFKAGQTQSLVVKVAQKPAQEATAHVEYVNANNGQTINNQSGQPLEFDLTDQSGTPINYDAYTQFLPQGYSYDGMGSHDSVIENGDINKIMVRPDQYRRPMGYIKIIYHDTKSGQDVDTLVLPGRDGDPFDIGRYENTLPYLSTNSDLGYSFSGVEPDGSNVDFYQGIHNINHPQPVTIDITPVKRPVSSYGQIRIHFVEANNVNNFDHGGQTQIAGTNKWVTYVPGSETEVLSGRDGDVFSPEVYEYNTPANTQYNQIVAGSDVDTFQGGHPQDIYIAVDSTKDDD